MNILSILRKILILIVIAGLGGLVYALSANIFIKAGIMPPDAVDTAFGFQMTQKAVIAWIITLFPAAAFLFLFQGVWRWFIITAPIYAPSIYALIFVLTNN